MITAFCNIYLNSEDKFEIFKQTFPLVYSISDNWLIYFRGKYRSEAFEFIKIKFSDYQNNCTFFSNLNDKNWAKSAQEMLDLSKYEYVYIYVEDHFLLKDIQYFENVLKDMIDNRIDTFQYSFFNVGMHINSVELLNPDYSKYFAKIIIEDKTVPFLKKEYIDFFPFSLISVSKKELLLKVLNVENMELIMLPFIFRLLLSKIGIYYPRNRKIFLFINKILNKLKFRCVMYSPASPVNLEKSIFECDQNIIPFSIGLLKEELFACYDDDNSRSDSCLIKRGLYPKNLKALRQDILVNIEQLKSYSMKKGEIEFLQFFKNTSKQNALPLKYLKVIEGKLKLVGGNEQYFMSANDHLIIHANLPHSIEAIEASKYCIKICFSTNFASNSYSS